MSFSAPIASVCMVLVNFVLCRWAIFGKREPVGSGGAH